MNTILNRCLEEVDGRFANMVARRRMLHRFPELSYHEEETAKLVYDQLISLQIEARAKVGGNGVVGTIYGGRPGPTVALRADMDALPIQDEKQCDYASQRPGVMHACGHDGHTAVLLEVAAILQQYRQHLNGNVRLIFQHAEEIAPGGAKPMIEAGALDGVDAVYGIHLWTPLPVGVVATRPGPMMAASDEFNIVIEGKGGHGGLPHETVDSVLVGAELTVSLQSIVSRSVNPVDPAVVSVGMFHAGTGFNVIAEQASLTGTVRTFSEATRQLIYSRLQELATHTAAKHGAKATLNYKWGYPVVVNDAEEAGEALRVAEALFGSAMVQEAQLIMVAEDFAYYLQHVPGTFLFVGAGNEEKGIIYPHHHPRFDLDEESLRTAAKLLIALAFRRLNGTI